MGESNSFPPGYHSVNPYLIINNTLEFIKFSELVFNAVVIKQIEEQTGMYAEIRIGDTCIMIEENREINRPNSDSFWVYVNDVDATYERAMKAGCRSLQSPAFKYDVDKVAKIVDRFGIIWFIATFNDKV